MLVLPLITIPIIFFLTVILKPWLMKWVHWNLCAVCIAVSLTWFILLILSLTGYTIDPIAIAILMGMSVTGLMYKLEVYFKTYDLHHLWAIRLLVVLGGYLAIYFLLSENWRLLLLVVIGTFLMMILISFLMQGVTHKNAVQSAEGKIKKTLLKKLDNCC